MTYPEKPLDADEKTASGASRSPMGDKAKAPLGKLPGAAGDVREHEEERLNPGGHGGSGAARHKPAAPSNSA